MRVIIGAIFLVSASSAGYAQQADVLQRLMTEPVTLFDWGLAQLDRDIARVVRLNLPQQTGSVKPLTGSIYDWRERRVTVYASIPVQKRQRTKEACALTYRDIVDTLSEGAPKGPNAAGWYLLNAFKPKAHFWGDRFEDIGRKLLDFVRLEVTLMPAARNAVTGDTKRVRCTGRLDAEAEDIRYDVSG